MYLPSHLTWLETILFPGILSLHRNHKAASLFPPYLNKDRVWNQENQGRAWASHRNTCREILWINSKIWAGYKALLTLQSQGPEDGLRTTARRKVSVNKAGCRALHMARSLKRPALHQATENRTKRWHLTPVFDSH